MIDKLASQLERRGWMRKDSSDERSLWRQLLVIGLQGMLCLCGSGSLPRALTGGE